MLRALVIALICALMAGPHVLAIAQDEKSQDMGTAEQMPMEHMPQDEGMNADTEGEEMVGGEAAEENAPMTDYAYGTVVSVNGDSGAIVITEYDWGTGEERSTSFSIGADLQIEGVDAWQNIPVGSSVDVEYIESEDGSKAATYISVYEEEEATAAPEQAPEQALEQQ